MSGVRVSGRADVRPHCSPRGRSFCLASIYCDGPKTVSSAGDCRKRAKTFEAIRIVDDVIDVKGDY